MSSNPSSRYIPDITWLHIATTKTTSNAKVKHLLPYSKGQSSQRTHPYIPNLPRKLRCQPSRILTEVTINELLERRFDVAPAPVLDVRIDPKLDNIYNGFLHARKLFHGRLDVQLVEVLKYLLVTVFVSLSLFFSDTRKHRTTI